MSLPGRLLYHFWHRPTGALRESLRHGGPLAQWRTERGRREMQAAASHLPVLPALAPAAGRQIHFLTGARFWWQTAFCLYSLARTSAVALETHLYDDGTLAAEHRENLLRLGLPLVFHDHAALREKLERLLPQDRYPTLRERWINYPHIRKLIDVHLGGAGWKLVLDSDLLFFRRPDLLLQWLAAPDRPLHAVDCIESYGYSRPLLERLAGRPLATRLNVGLCGLNSSEIDWDQLEFWSATLIREERTNYYLEQALVALLCAGRPCAVTPEKDYVTLPTPSEIINPSAVMHHYVDTAKGGYFRHAWREAINA